MSRSSVGPPKTTTRRLSFCRHFISVAANFARNIVKSTRPNFSMTRAGASQLLFFCARFSLQKNHPTLFKCAFVALNLKYSNCGETDCIVIILSWKSENFPLLTTDSFVKRKIHFARRGSGIYSEICSIVKASAISKAFILFSWNVCRTPVKANTLSLASRKLQTFQLFFPDFKNKCYFLI